MLPHHRFRFFNGGLRPGVYDRCVIPTKPPHLVAAHALPAETYARHAVARAPAFTHLEHLPPPGAIQPPQQQLAMPFRTFQLPLRYSTDDDAPALPPAAGKRKRVAAAEPKPKKERAKKTNGQKRREGPDAPVFRSAKIEILPTRRQFREFMATFRVATDVYNWANGAVRLGGLEPTHYGLRGHFAQFRPVDIRSTANGAPPVPVASRVVSYAIKELAEAHQRHSSKPFRVHDRYLFATPERPTATFTLEKSFSGVAAAVRFGPPRPVLNHKGHRERHARGRAECDMFLGNNFERVGAIRLRDSAAIIARLSAEGKHLKENAKVLWDKRTNKLYLLYLYTVPRLADPDPDFAHKRIVATDPGCAPFQAWYSPTSGAFGECLSGMREQLKARCLALDARHSKLERHRHRATTSRRRAALPPARRALRRQGTTRAMRGRLQRERVRLTHWVTAAHYDTAHFLLERHDVLIQPKLETRRLTQRTQGLFRNGLARRLYSWSHYLFRQRLKSASARYAGRHVLESTEPGTSKTCTHCGFWKADLRLGDKTFRCPRCALCVDRQLAGARNNFLAAYGIATGVGWDGVVDGGQ